MYRCGSFPSDVVLRILAILTVKVLVRVTGMRKQKKLKLAIEAEGWMPDGCN